MLCSKACSSMHILQMYCYLQPADSYNIMTTEGLFWIVSGFHYTSAIAQQLTCSRSNIMHSAILQPSLEYSPIASEPISGHTAHHASTQCSVCMCKAYETCDSFQQQFPMHEIICLRNLDVLPSHGL